MAQWGSGNDANNSPNWTPALVNKTPNTANRDALFGNTTANAFVADQTVGIFGTDANTAAANNVFTHEGWTKITTGSGGRAGRVHAETLVAGFVEELEAPG